MFLRKKIKSEKSPIKKSVFLTTDLILWIIILSSLFLMGNLLLKISTYGVKIVVKSTALTLKMLTKPLFSPFIWSSDPESSVLHFVMNMGIFFVVFTFGFWVRQYKKVMGVILLLVFFIATGIWYYVYILSEAVM
ncbi:hypothetical protein [Bacillus sp. Marseille-Q1617]|uniref:hypothetical protein n=1 Tax=Bacillus sp. Marseille-Q1617 TaxID=2736887 RepID=UPI00158AA29C|nr:hypothetical protein [Bacillus sp. Marseille-Q1617]